MYGRVLADNVMPSSSLFSAHCRINTSRADQASSGCQLAGAHGDVTEKGQDNRRHPTLVPATHTNDNYMQIINKDALKPQLIICGYFSCSAYHKITIIVL